ncbi:MAG: hypothetical protein IKX86_01460 [Clostridia bacterium]|nr:hypothetical protein [Clostridia bacterium]
MKKRDYNAVDFGAEYNMPALIPPTLKDDRSFFGAGGDPTLKYRGQKQNAAEGEKARIKRHAILRKMFLWPVASTLAAVTIIFSSFGIDPLGDDFLVHGWDEWDHLIHYDEEPELFAPESLELYDGEERDLGAWVNRSAVSIIYECSDETVAVVDEFGLVTGRRPGSAVIKVTSPEIGQSAEVSITVTEAPFIEMPSSVTLSFGQTAEIGARVVGYRESDFPDGEPTLVYEYSGGSVASVTQQGTVTATGYGYVVVTVRCPALKLESTVTVTVSASGLHLSSDNLRMYRNSSARLDLALLDGDENTVNVSLSFESTEPEVMTVEPDGTVIIGDDPGEHVVTVRCDVLEFESAVTVTVIRPEIDINEKTSASLGDEWDIDPRLIETVSEDETPAFTFLSSNTEIITVSPEGRVSVVGEGGSATITVTCSDPYVYRETVVSVELHEHVYGEWTVLSEASCTESGHRERVCSICGDTEEESISALGHDYLTNGAVCSRCGKSLVTLKLVTHSRDDIDDNGVTTTLSPTGAGSKSSNPIEVIVEYPFELLYSFNESGVDKKSVVCTCEPQTSGGDTFEKIDAFIEEEGICNCWAMMQTEDDPPTQLTLSFRYNRKSYKVPIYFRIIDIPDDNP